MAKKRNAADLTRRNEAAVEKRVQKKIDRFAKLYYQLDARLFRVERAIGLKK